MVRRISLWAIDALFLGRLISNCVARNPVLHVSSDRNTASEQLRRPWISPAILEQPFASWIPLRQVLEFRIRPCPLAHPRSAITHATHRGNLDCPKPSPRQSDLHRKDWSPAGQFSRSAAAIPKGIGPSCQMSCPKPLTRYRKRRADPFSAVRCLLGAVHGQRRFSD